MKIEKDTVVSLLYRVTDTQGQILDEGDQPMLYLHGGYEEIFPRIEALLNGKEPGFSAQVQLEPEDAFGEYDASLLRMESRDLFPDEIEVGMQFEGVPADLDDTDDADENAHGEHIYTVTDIADGQVMLDGNHPYAGIALRFDLKVLAVRLATAQEIEQGFATDDSGLTIASATAMFEEEDDDGDEDGEHNAARQRPRTLH